MIVEPNENDEYVEKNFFSQDIPVSERTHVFNKLFFHYKKDWQSSFVMMSFLSVGIATLGLSQDSSVTIIGAMIIAPLGQPIVAFGGAIALGWRIQALRMLLIIILVSVASIFMAYLVGFTLPDLTPNQQILIRTSPDLRDLGIAILAGAAGAYGYYRSEYSTILAGVAIAVALVPPLCTCGLMLEQGHYILASGALLLFITNFTGITIAALLVFFFLGLKNKINSKWFWGGAIAVVSLCAVIILPLALNYQKFSSGVQFQSSIYEKAGKVLKQNVYSANITDISIQGNGVVITIDANLKDENTREILIKNLEQTIGMQVFLETPKQIK